MISVLVATHNGAPTLPLTLEAFCALDIPDSGVEFIVVDNASTDDTAEILESYKKRLPLKILYEPTPGKTHALNQGLAAVAGELVLFSDDDVIPDRNWLTAYMAAADAHADTDIFAGQVRHYWQKKPPKWLERLAAEGKSYGGTHIDRPHGPIEAHAVKGANFMVRAHVFQNHKFREDVGYGAGGQMVAGDETDFVRRLLDAGLKSWFVPEARVRHIVRPYQVRIWPVLQRYFRIGRGTEAVGAQTFPQDLPTLFGYPRYLCKILPPKALRACGHFLRFDPYSGMNILIEIAVTCGRAFQWRQTRRLHQSNARNLGT